MSLVSLLVPMLLAAAPAVEPQPCKPLPGIESLAAMDSLRWLVVGELHGTNEVPAAFLDLVCALSDEASVIVAVEQPQSEQSAIDEFINSNGSLDAKNAFLSSQIWHGRSKDGRSSQAYFRLFESLRQMRSEGRIKRVMAFQPSFWSAPPSQAEYEKQMAELLLPMADEARLVVALVGSFHARLKPLSAAGLNFTPMAGHLPQAETVALDARVQGGMHWACFEPTRCGPTAAGLYREGPGRSIIINENAADGFSGILYLGVPATVSEPQ